MPNPQLRVLHLVRFALNCRVAFCAFLLQLALPCYAEVAPQQRSFEPVSFLYAPSSRSVGSFLLAGPFAEPDREVEQIQEFVEGDLAGVGGEWRIGLLEANTSLAIFDSKEGDGYYYLHCELPPHKTREQTLLVGLTKEASLIVKKKITSLPTGRVVRFSIPAGVGNVPIMLRFKYEGRPIGISLNYGTMDSLNRLRRTPVILNLKDASKERLTSIASTAFELHIEQGVAVKGGEFSIQLKRVAPCPMPTAQPMATFNLAPEECFSHAREERVGGKISPTLANASVATKWFNVLEDKPEFTATVALDLGYGVVKKSSIGLTKFGLDEKTKKLKIEAEALLHNKNAPQSVAAWVLLQLEKMELSRDRLISFDGKKIADVILSAQDALLQASRGVDFQLGKTGSLELAYWSGVDESPQPYLVHVPQAAIISEEALPLIVFLHGYAPSYDKDSWSKISPLMAKTMEAENAIFCVPFARSNTDFLTVGEDDVLRTIEELKSRYRIDSDRIYLYGYSMGGSGAWTMLTHYPSMFAGAIIIAGRSDYYFWHGVDRLKFPEWKRFMIDLDNPIALAKQIAHIPVRVYHGRADYLVKPEQSSEMVKKLNSNSSNATLTMTEGDHWSFFSTVMAEVEPVSWLCRQKRRAAPPKDFEMVANHIRYANVWGVRALGLSDTLAPIRIKFTELNGEQVVMTSNATALEQDKTINKIEYQFRDEETIWQQHAVGDFTIARPASYKKTPLLIKRVGLAGPVKDVLRSDFILVYGSMGAHRDELQAAANTFADEWRSFAKGRPRVIADTELTEVIISTRNLVLFGTSSSNSVIAKIAPKLPITWTKSHCSINNITYPMQSPQTKKERGLMFCYPNPIAPSRMVVIAHGLKWGGNLPVNHKWDWVPDYILFEDEVDPTDQMDPVNMAVVGGFFNSSWKFLTK